MLDAAGKEVLEMLTGEPLQSKVPLSILKEKQPSKLLEFYERLYFEGK